MFFCICVSILIRLPICYSVLNINIVYYDHFRSFSYYVHIRPRKPFAFLRPMLNPPVILGAKTKLNIDRNTIIQSIFKFCFRPVQELGITWFR